MSINIPPQIVVPFATSGLKNSIPAASNNTTGNAGYNQGFPASNMTPRTAGGIPPFGQDVNGILFDVTTALQYQQAGGLFPYSSSFSAAVGGYPIGAIVLNAAKTGLWLNQVANNTTNPDTGGAGWINPVAGRLLGVKVFGTTTTYTPTPGTNSVIIELVGGGGGGGGCPATASGQWSVGAGGGGGSYTKTRLTSGFSAAAVSIGGGGAGGNGNGSAGANGTLSSFASTITASGGFGGNNMTPTSSTPIQSAGGLGGVIGATGNIQNSPGYSGGPGVILVPGNGVSGFGGGSMLAAGGASSTGTAPGGGGALGAGGGGGISQSSPGVGANGGGGGNGICIIWEYA